MRNKHESNEKKAVQPPAAEQQSAHAEFITHSIPAWLVSASPERREALKNAPLILPDWYLAASQAQRQALNASFVASVTSQNLLDKTMSRLQDIDTFAQPLLVKALKDQFAVELDVTKTFLQLKKPLEMGILEIDVGTFEVLKLPLLQAALHNFEERECAPAHFHSSSGFVVESTPGQFRQLTTALTVMQFLKLCRELDIGAQYQAYLKDFLQPSNPVAEVMLHKRFVNSQKDAMRAAAELALLKKDIEPKDYSMILSVIAGELNPTIDNTPVWICDLVLMKKRMTGCVLFHICEKYRYSDDVLLYIPHDPEHPLKRYKGREMEATLKRLFMAADASQSANGGPTAYQRFFSQFVAYADRPYYFSQFTRKAADSPPDSLALFRSPFWKAIEVLPPFLSTFYQLKELPPESPSRQEPVDELYLPIKGYRQHGLWGPNVDPWADLYEQSLQKILADARSHAVPTADVDARVRAEKIAHLQEVGMLVLNITSMFVPVLGEVMMGVMAGQILYETFEGAIEWSEGDRRAAWVHLTDVAENLALIAVLHGAGKGLAKLTAVKPEPLVEGLKPVTLPTGQQRLWKPDLGPYKAPITLPADSKPDGLGLHSVNGQAILPLDEARFMVKQDPANGEYCIQNPRRPEAYSPRLEHNGAGAWSHEGEEPLSWDGSILMRRLGYRAQAFTDAQLEQVRTASGVEHDQLRRLHVEQQQPSAQMSDTLTRFRIDRDIETFRDQIGSDDPEVYAKADLRLQFRLMRSQELLPATPAIKVLDSKANLIWEDPVAGPGQSRRLTFVVSDRDAANGTVLRSLLDLFKAQQVGIENVPGTADMTLEQRAASLRKEIARAAQNRKYSLFESLYREQDANAQGSVARIKVFFPQLPSVVVQEILEGATQAERLEMDNPGPLPQRIYEQAEQARQELRVAHAFEGLYIESSSSVDSERLVLRSLETLPGWPTDVHLELREYGAQGKLLDAIGPAQNPVRAVLVVDANTRFAQSTSASLYSSVLQALTAEERQALGFTLQDAERLKMTVQQTPLPRDQLRVVLQKHRVLKPSVEPGMKLLGGVGPLPLGQQVASFFRTPRMRTLKLYPDFSEVEVESFLRSLGEDVRGGLTRREAEFATLKNELDTWVQSRATAERSSTVTGRFPGGRERQIASNLKRSWRRQSGSTLSIDSTVELPSLSARFEHVETLALTGTGVRNLNAFLKGFSDLKTLKLEGMSRLNELPEAVGEMQGLTHLSLRGSRVRWNEHTAAVLGKSSALETLDLLKNPLGIAPDFSTMTRLKNINLSGTGIDQWPLGTGNLPDLQVLDLRENELTEVPREMLSTAGDHLEANARVSRVTLLEGNPFTRQGWQQLKDYRDRLQALRPELLEGSLPDAFKVQDSMSARIRQLYPGFDEFEVEAFLQTHGLAAETELARLEREYETLNQQLSAWAFSGGGTRSRYVRAGQMAAGLSDRAERYTAADRIRECWRRQSPQRNAVDGSPIGFELDLSGQTLDSVPDLEADFSHVGSLKLNNMGLSVSPEGFLAHFKGVRWLDLSNNQLTAIPSALDDMHGLTRLFLQCNRIHLTPETAGILSRRTTLRAMKLAQNPLGMAPDFTQITDMRSLNLNSIDIETWPVGLGAQPLLDVVDLRNNRITTIPESVIAPPAEQLARVARRNQLIHIGGNPLSEVAQQQLRDYWSRLEREHPDLWGARLPGVFEYQAPTGNAIVGGQEMSALQRWLKDLPADQIPARQAQWQSLSAQQGSQEFFQVLGKLENAGAGHADLQRRVWEVVDTITEVNPESVELRQEMFEWAGRPACCDRAALSFSNLEIMAMVYRARTLAMDGEQSAALLKLSRGLFRLDEVEKIALADIAQRTAAINNTPGLSAALKTQQIRLLEEVEIKLAYRYGLKDRLGLPGQPRQVHFAHMGKVTPAMLDQAYSKVLALDDSPEEFQSLVAKDFWKDFVTNKYRAQFEAQREPYQDRLASLRDRQQAGELSEAQFKVQSADLDAQLQIEEAVLIEQFTREELAKHPI